MESPENAATIPRPQPDRWPRIAFLLAILATTVAVLLRVVFWLRAGGLWRDEAGLAGLSNLPRWSDVWSALTHDSFPILLPAIIRFWCGLGWGHTDLSLRILGLTVGVFMLAAFWLAARSMRGGTPLLALSLVALSGLTVRAEDSLRAYGLGCVLNVLTLALVWRAVRKPGHCSLALAAIAAVLSVQCLYQNAFFVLAACLGGIVVCARARRFRDALWILGIGLAAAVSLLPYAGPMVHSQDWWQIQKMGFHPAASWRAAAELTGFPFAGGIWLWISLGLLALLFALWPARAPEHLDLVVFCTVALGAGTVGFCVFIWMTGLLSPYWYFLPLLAFAVACLDGALAGCARWWLPCLCALTLVACGIACQNGLAAVKSRQTNMDLAAEAVARQAVDGDYVIVAPWIYGVSFARYYHGAAAWTTVPPLEDHVFHRYDLFKVRMQEPQPLQPVFTGINAALQGGHRVWLVGSLGLMSTNPPPVIGPAPNAYGWHEWIYEQAWGEQTGYEIMMQATEQGEITNLTSEPINPFENVKVDVFTGWKGKP